MTKPLIIGHACAAGEAPANTLAGVRACIDAPVHAMEIDVQLSADGVPVLMHDETVDRTTNLSGPVRELSLAALQAADAGDGEPVPTLDQVFETVEGRFAVMCELKQTTGDPEHDQRLVDAVLEVVRKHDAYAWAAIHSFDPAMVERGRATEPRLSAALITPAVPTELLDRLLNGVVRRNAQAVSVEHSCVTPELVLRAKQRQVTLWTWTVDRPEDWERVVSAGVDGVITNVPHRLREWLERRET